MQLAKKTSAIILAFVMLFAMCATAFADGDGSITVNNTTNGKTYEIYKIFDLTQNGTAVSYTIDNDWENFFFNGGAGSSYLLTEQPQGEALNQLIHNGTVYYINITDANISGFANVAQSYAVPLTADGSMEAAGNSATFTGLDLGYYLVLPVDATEIASGHGSICSLTNAAPDGTINAKGEYPTVDKEVDDQDVEVGQEVTWTVTGKVPDTLGYDTFIYRLTDTMSEGLTFGDSIDATNFEVKFGNTVVIDSANPVSANDSLTFTDNGYVLTMDMTKYQAYKGQPITVTYMAIINDNAVCNYTHNLVELDYGHDPEDLEEGNKITKIVYSSKIVIDKYDANDASVKLEGAKFVMYRLGENNEKLYYQYTPADGTTPAKVEWIPEGANGAIPAEATVMTTDNNGAASFLGLESGEYYLHETESPVGYNLLMTDPMVTVTAPGQDGEGNQIGVSVTKEVANNSGSTLPETGGMGTRIFYAVGAVLLIGAGVILFVRRRMSLERE